MESFKLCAVDAAKTAKIVSGQSWKKLYTDWLLVPAGCLCVMLLVFGLRLLIGMGDIDFPASVLLLIALFLTLVALDFTLSKDTMKKIIDWLNIPLGFTLRYINLFFTPPFVMLPKTAEPVSGADLGKIIALFFIGWAITTPIIAWMVRGYNLFFMKTRTSETILDRPSGKGRFSLPFFRNAHKPSVISTAPSTITVGTAATADDEKFDKSTSTSEFVSRDVSTFDVASNDKDVTIDISLPNTMSDKTEDPSSPKTRPERWAEFVIKYFDTILWTTFFLLIGLPTYYATTYTMPAFLSSTILFFFFAQWLPKSWKMVLHPIITTTGLTILFIWLLAVTKSMSLNDALATYQVGNTHRTLFHPRTRATLPNPGAGDFLTSLLDVSVVAFALPMYRFRRELFTFFIPLVLSTLLFCFACMFLYPLVGYAIGLSPDRALAFAARSVSMPMAIIVAETLDADIALTAALAAVSGIIGAIMGLQYLRLVRIPDDDFVAKGISLGLNSAAPVTALLLEVDPAAGALSSLCLSLIGIFMIVFTVIPAVADAMRSLVGL